MKRPYEVSVQVALGHYVPGTSLLHRLDPRAKLVIFLLFVSASVVVGTVTQNAVLLIVFALLMPLGQLSLRYALSTLRPALPAMLLILLLQLLFIGDSAAAHSTVYLKWGFLSITADSVRLVLVSLLRVIGLILLISALTLTTSAAMLTHGVEGLLAPLRKVRVPVSEIALVFTIALRFAPVLAEQAERLMKGQAARGATGATARPWQIIRRTRSVLPVIVPLFLQTLRRAEALALAMEARGFVPGAPRTSYQELLWRRIDTLACTGATVIVMIIGLLSAWQVA